jgi:hypothetical protein
LPRYAVSWLNDNAAGWGWFVDPTPGDDRELTTRGKGAGHSSAS